jgi:pimeloyl-ACP methyl ester carboxylesterase
MTQTYSTAIRPDVDSLVSDHFTLDSDTPGISLHLRHRRLADLETFNADNTLVMVHGASYSSGSLYDVRYNGMSFIDYLALSGLSVYALDVRGYGHSTRPSEMSLPAEDNLPLCGTEIGIRDLNQVVDWVREKHQLERVQIFGMSWGGSVAGAFTSRYNDKVNKLVVLAPQWLNSGPMRIDNGGKIGAYRLIPVSQGKANWLAAAPAEHRDGLIPEGWFEAWAEQTLAEDPQSQNSTPAVLRAVNGPVQDVRNFWAVGKPFYRPQDVTRPVLLVHGEWDADVPLRIMSDYFTSFTRAPVRRWVEIGESTHMMLMEKNRLQAYRAVSDFYLRQEPEE